MKKRAGTIIAILAMLIFVLGMTVTAYALSSYNLSGTYKDIWVASGGTGINRSIWVDVDNTNNQHHTDIRMLDKNGNVVWEEYGAIDYSSRRLLWCGSNVYHLQARVGAKTILGELINKFAICAVWMQ